MHNLHEWNVSYAEARQLQTDLAGRVRFDRLQKQPSLIAGLDCAFSTDGKRILAAAVLLRVLHQEERSSEKTPSFAFEHVETVTASAALTFPYIPGLLSFREAPACLAAAEKLKHKPDVFLIDGQGIAHMRRLGLAAHLGLFFDAPTIGCAKSRLTGTHESPGREKGSHTPLRDGDEIIGAVVRTRTGVKPVFVSVGHKCRLEDAVRITLACATRYRLPEPTRLAHHAVSDFKKSLV